MNVTKNIAAIAAALLLTTTTAFAQEEENGTIELIPNSVKYSDSGMKNATGRSGAASVEARALLSRNGTTQIEATTGVLDSGAAAPGSIDKLKVKIGDVATNYNNLDGGGFFAVTMTGLARHTPLQIQTNVSGIDPTRTDVVTVDETVKRRPDLRVMSVSRPAAVQVSQPFTVAALVRELNGDVGARTNCLLNDQFGNVVDRADGIWVDAGDTVQCMFSVTLDALGRHTLVVKLDGTMPADWDTRFESSAFNLLVTTDGHWDATSSQRTTYRRNVTTNSADPDHPSESINTETHDRFDFHAVVDAPIDYNNFKLFIEEKTDGNLIYRYDPAGGFTPDFQNTGCRSSDRRHALYTVCRFGDRLALNVASYAGNAVYFSAFWVQKLDPATGQYGYVRATMTQKPSSGPLLRYGSTHEVQIRLYDALNTWEAMPFIHLQPWENPAEESTSCRTLWDGSTECTETTFQEKGKEGSASL